MLQHRHGLLPCWVSGGEPGVVALRRVQGARAAEAAAGPVCAGETRGRGWPLRRRRCGAAERSARQRCAGRTCFVRCADETEPRLAAAAEHFVPGRAAAAGLNAVHGPGRGRAGAGRVTRALKTGISGPTRGPNRPAVIRATRMCVV